MSARSLLIALRRVGASLAQYIREVQAAHERYRARFATREARGVNLLRGGYRPSNERSPTPKDISTLSVVTAGSDTAFTMEI